VLHGRANPFGSLTSSSVVNTSLSVAGRLHKWVDRHAASKTGNGSEAEDDSVHD